MKTLVVRVLLALAIIGSAVPGTPLVASARQGKAADASMIEARTRFFGPGNVDPITGEVRADRLIMSWFSVANYAVAIRGHIVLFDAWIARGSHSGYVPTSPEELIALQPEYIFAGHGDFDHLADAAEIAAATGATLVGSPEHCDSVRGQAGADASISCVEAIPRGAPPGVVNELKLLPGVGITAISHVHSSVEQPEQADGGRLPCIPLWNAVDTAENPPTPEDMEHLLRHLPDARGGNILYQFRVGPLAITWHDTTGKLAEDAPQVIDALKALPPTDIHFGAILAFGQVTNCFRSLAMYIEALSPKVFASSHNDNFTWFIGANARDLEPLVVEELERIPESERPALLYAYDPEDYIDPSLYTFDPSARKWR